MQRGQIIQALDNVTWTARQAHLQIRRRLQAPLRPRRQRLRQLPLRLVCLRRLLGCRRRPSAIPTPRSCSAIPTTPRSAPPTIPPWTASATPTPSLRQDDWKVTPSLTLNLGPALRTASAAPRDALQHRHLPARLMRPAPTAANQVNGAVVVPNAQALVLRVHRLRQRHRAHADPHRCAGRHSRGAALHRQHRLGSAPRLCLAALRQRQDRAARRLGTLHRVAAGLLAGLRLGRRTPATWPPTTRTTRPTASLRCFRFANPFNTAAGSSTGTAGFYYAFPIHYNDPTVQQWNLTFEQDFGHSIGVRLSYTGSHGQNLEAMVDLNQVPANSVGYYNTDPALRPLAPASPMAARSSPTTVPIPAGA